MYLLARAEFLHRYGGEGDRMGICLKLEHETAQLDKLPHSHEAPHDWAIRSRGPRDARGRPGRS